VTITRIDVPGPPTFTRYLRDITERKAAEAELRHSQARIVDSADAARRRLERDLHDGAQQRLITVGLTLRTAETHLDSAANPALAQALTQAVEELKARACRAARLGAWSASRDPDRPGAGARAAGAGRPRPQPGAAARRRDRPPARCR
jgi:hypothetical protein